MYGLIGFFDILGYQSFLENNSSIESALEVLDIVINIPNEVKQISKEIATEDTYFEEYDDSLNHIVFSDTIVFTFAYPDDDAYPDDTKEEWIRKARIYMSSCCGLLVSIMFQKGLPVRGAIHEGEFVYQGMCLAGKAVIKSYRQSESLNFSGLVYSETLGKEICSESPNGKLIFPYLAPQKNGEEEKLITLNWLVFLDKTEREKLKNNIEQYVWKQFWEHQKDCSASVDVKVHNTIKAIRKMLLKIELYETQQKKSQSASSKGKSTK